jgi:hypothetical protein
MQNASGSGYPHSKDRSNKSWYFEKLAGLSLLLKKIVQVIRTAKVEINYDKIY